jgi:hypothetical protein
MTQSPSASLNLIVAKFAYTLPLNSRRKTWCCMWEKRKTFALISHDFIEDGMIYNYYRQEEIMTTI